MRYSPQVRRFLVSVAAVATLSISFAAASSDNPRERAEMLASQAEKILNTWSGRRETLSQARQFIIEALQLDPDNAHALVERGRLVLMSDGRNTGYSPQAAQEARMFFISAAQQDPPYGRAFVLMGHLYTEIGLYQEASQALTRADALVPNDPWLKLNWGAYYTATGQPDKAVAYAEQAIATGTTNPKALKSAYGIVLKDQMRKGNRARADEIYSLSAAISRDDAWTRGNYAQNVMLYFGDFEAGEKLAREALDIMDYGHARGSLSLALYGKWAQAQKDGKPLAEQEALFAAANENDPGGRTLPSCAMNNQRVAFVFDALFKKGVERTSLRRC